MDQRRGRRGAAGRWRGLTIPYAAKTWKIDRLVINPRARAGRFNHDRNRHEGLRSKTGQTIQQQLTMVCRLFCRVVLDSHEHWVRECGHPDLSPVHDGAYLEGGIK